MAYPVQVVFRVLRAVGLVLFYFVFSIGITFYNKWLMNGFHYPLFMTLVHLAINFCLSALTRRAMQYWTGKPRIILSWRDYIRKVAPTAFATALDIGLSNWSFLFITISLYTMTKSSAVLFILFFSLVFKLEEPNPYLILVVLLISSGVFMFAFKSTQFNLEGFIMVLLAAFLGGIRWTLTQLLMQKAELGLQNPIDTMYHLHACQLRTYTVVVNLQRQQHIDTGVCWSLEDATLTIYILRGPTSKIRMEAQREKSPKCGTICLKYLLFLFNILFWIAGGAVLAVGLWTLLEKSDYISLLNSSLYSASAYILIAAGVIVIVTGIIGCCGTLKEMKSLLIVYLILLLSIFLLEIVACVLAYINYQECFPFCYQLDGELGQNLKLAMQQKYQQPGEDSVTQAVDKLQQEFKCCGSNNFSDWTDSVWFQAKNNQRLVPDSCCKTPTDLCGLRDHPSNIYKVEGGCIMKLEDFILSQLYILGAVSIGIACLQLLGMLCTCCLYQNLKKDSY